VDGDVTQIEAIASWAAEARSGVAFTGAGISTESGISDFRGPGGFWERNDQTKFTIQNYVRDPEHRKERWRMAVERRSFMRMDVKPNAGHIALARMEELGVIRGVITQNVDNLHVEAGSRTVVELHGNSKTIVCLSCDASWPSAEVLERVRNGEEDPHCTECGGIIKSATISFGQNLPPAAIEQAQELSATADFFLVVGSSLIVYPAAAYPGVAKQAGAKLVIINREPTDQDYIADALIHADAGPTLTAIVDLVREMKSVR
jgi:NAD-dependent deacetylase